MTRSQPRGKKDYKNETIRRKKAPKTTPVSRQSRAAVKRRRKNLSQEQTLRESAVHYASRLFREGLGGKRRIRKVTGSKRGNKPAPRVLRPPSFEKLRKLFPPGHLRKPIRVGDTVLFVFPKAGRVKAWLQGVVDHIVPHKSDSNWILIRYPKISPKHKNPFIAIDSPNVYLAPATYNEFDIALPGAWPTRGVYVLYSPEHKEFYVGNSNNIPDRIEEHRDTRPRFLGYSGAKWTKRWQGAFYRIPPCTPQCVGTLQDQEWEARETAALCELYGASKVRGGGMSSSQQ